MVEMRGHKATLMWGRPMKSGSKLQEVKCCCAFPLIFIGCLLVPEVLKNHADRD